METVNNMASAAAKAVWGDSSAKESKEPVSGQVGDTSKGEPFDAGNLETPQTERKNPTEATENTTTSTNHPTTTTTSADKTEDTDGPAQFAKTTGTAAESSETPNNPSTELKAKDAPKDTSKGQGDVRDPEDPLTHPKSAPTDVNDADEANEGGGPNKAPTLDGPGPKPIEEVAREHGGDAGSHEALGGAKSEDLSKTKSGSEPEGQEGGKSKSEGTGEEWVKSSGLKADGGDFDATKPGAGREADRLMEEKGLHPPGSGAGSSSHKGGEDDVDNTKSDDSPDKKKSIGQKIKDKLHRHKD